MIKTVINIYFYFGWMEDLYYMKSHDFFQCQCHAIKKHNHIMCTIVLLEELYYWKNNCHSFVYHFPSEVRIIQIGLHRSCLRSI